MLLPDVNVWLALTFDSHVHHPASRGQSPFAWPEQVRPTTFTFPLARTWVALNAAYGRCFGGGDLRKLVEIL